MSRPEKYTFFEPASTTQAAAPKPSLTLFDAIALIVGVVIGAGIFKAPADVASNVGNEATALLLWVAGGAISFIGALCYAELATTYPDVGGTYFYLKRAFGMKVAFLFAWARMTVIQTGSIALLAFVFGDYASEIFNFGTFSSSVYAAFVIVLFTALNIIGLHQGKSAQNLLAIAQVLGLLVVIASGIAFVSPPTAVTAPPPESSGTIGLAMVFVLLAYGGWNEAAFISAEIQNRQRNILRSLLWSIGIITGIYLLLNLAFLRGLGLNQVAQSKAVAADLMRQTLGEPGAVFISLLVSICALSSINASIFTGARTNYALGQDFSLFRFMGRWRERSSTPTIAYLLQAAIALALVFLGTITTRAGFQTMVDYTAPVFWFFFLLSGISLLVLRQREPNMPRPFRVPLYPITPLLFIAACGYLLYSSLDYTKVGAIVGVVVVALGIPFLVWNHHHSRSH